MAPIVTRLIMSFALLVATPTLFFILLFTLFEILDQSAGFSRSNEELFFVCAVVLCLAFFGLGWWLIWRSEVKWTSRRGGMTLGVAGVGLVLGAIVAAAVAAQVRYGEGLILGSMMGGLLWIVWWLFGTAVVWRETKSERAERLASMGVGALPCPGCGYNLSGLRESKCPECGAGFTLDQLYLSIEEQRRPVG